MSDDLSNQFKDWLDRQHPVIQGAVSIGGGLAALFALNRIAEISAEQENERRKKALNDITYILSQQNVTEAKTTLELMLKGKYKRDAVLERESFLHMFKYLSDNSTDNKTSMLYEYAMTITSNEQ